MATSLIASILAGLFTMLLKYLAGRAEMRSAVLLSLEREEHRRALEAALWLAAHPIILDGSGLADFASLQRVRGPGATTDLPGVGGPPADPAGTDPAGTMPGPRGGTPDMRGDTVE